MNVLLKLCSPFATVYGRRVILEMFTFSNITNGKQSLEICCEHIFEKFVFDIYPGDSD